MNYLLPILLIISGITAPLFSSLATQVDSYAKNHSEEKSKDIQISLEKELFQQLVEKKVIRREGTDSEMRPLFVGLQATIEKMITEMLAKGTCDKAIGIILTPAPPTPLCTKGEISKELVHPSILQNEKSLQTVKDRPSILRSYLEVGGRIYAAFPEGGSALRTEDQLAIFYSLSAAYPDRLITSILQTKSVEESKIGATYFFKEKGTDQWMMFSIHSTQAISPKDDTIWGLWLGPVEHPEVLQKAQEITTYIKRLGQPGSFPAEMSSVLEGSK